MKSVKIYKQEKSIELQIDTIAPDKSISHRCAMFSILSDKPSIIKNFLRAEDTLNSLKIVSQLGATIDDCKEYIKITPPKVITEPNDVLDCGNSGTSMRLFCGLLSSMSGFFVLSGDKYLRKRPMKRVVEPLKSIGAIIDGRDNSNLAPLAIRGAKLKSFDYYSNISSAQVKSALILAGLNSDESSYFSEIELSRDHTERMLNGMGAKLEITDKIKINPIQGSLNPLELTVPSDPSSAFFFAVAAVISKNLTVVLKNLTLNPTRIEAFKVLEKMGASITYNLHSNQYEPIGDIIVKSSSLNGVEVSQNISWLIDEIPALSIAMAMAKGRSVVKNAKELRVKESDRIKTVVDNLKLCGVDVIELDDGFEIIGSTIKKATINSFGDHRIAMSFAIAGICDGMNIDDVECINTSFPNFFDILSNITRIE
ncbi:MAG: 3-phosphoshikimate 1-carboxyvinyltransferase [Campylobacterales bacterium]|nr:3-phosphoshikimate 1-carboxyvinyltransferase [Campylobacterales bacterium]